jgi:transcriptional regulator with XRE-family HTH domain
MINSINNESLSIYGSWNMEMPSVSTRSRLYNLEPIGMGTGHAESLTSYIARLAAAHSLTPAVLLGRTLTSVMDKRYWLQDGMHPGSRRSPLGNSFGEYAKAINGIGVIAKDWVTALQNLTLRSDLNLLTMLPWAEVFTHRNLLRPSRTWCPSCYHDWRLDGQQIYEPLLWTFRDLEVCTKHQRRLISQCQHCGQRIPWLGRCAQPGYCSKCGEWLGASLDKVSNETPILDHELEQQIWIGKSLEELIIAARRLPSPAKERTAQSISLCVNQASDGVMNRFARLIGKRKNTVWGWQHGQTQIPIDDLLRICNRVGISVVDFLYADAFVLDDIDLIQTPTAVSGVKAKRRSPRELDRAVTERALSATLAEETPLSMRAVAEKLDLNKRLLYRHFPELCKAISAGYKKHRHAQYDNRRDQYEKEVRQTTAGLRASGIYPSRRRVSRLIKSRTFHNTPGGNGLPIRDLQIAA